ncbi:WD repeat-containing protein [Klebsormidium nitens]|uniref:WD repeat-containing protein n=1 Tax=Klebsormidium nitens TaxID=105231 RepID=A0A1Y1IHT1_KLENI|nr:WD repeat-containing protein [Klebsormidium nitens]|eukprot:GAQ88207.1 WD repeat-containing protein [Klebsormidium nitens]
MAPRRQSKRGKEHADLAVDTSTTTRSKRIKAESDPLSGDQPTDQKAGNEQTVGISPPGGAVRTTRSLRGVKSQLQTPDNSKVSESESGPVSNSEPLSEISKSKSGSKVPESETVSEEPENERTKNENGEELTEYERARRETMAKNEAMLMSLGVTEAAEGLGASIQAKRSRAAAKGLQTVRAKKEKKEPVEVRRSSRIQHIAPESLGIERENRDGSVVLHGQEAPFRRPAAATPAPWEEKRRIQGPIKFESSNTDDPASDAAFLDVLKRLRDDQPLRKRAAEAPSVDPTKLTLRESDVARVVKDRIFAVAFFPTTEKVIVAAGDKSGGLGIWDVDAKDTNDGVHVFNVGPKPISALAVSNRDCTKLYSCSFDGSLRVLDVEKGVFDEAYVDEESDFSAMSLGPVDGGHVAYVGDGLGALTVVDLRASTAQVTYQMHGRKINTIDFNPHRSHIFVTGGTDAMAHIWDVRKLPESGTKKVIHPLASLPHVKAVNSIYFSPDGDKLASTSYDNYIRIYDGMLDSLEHVVSKVTPPQPLLISHYNNTGRWISSFRAVWTWDNRHVAVGSMNRAIDIVNVESKHLKRLASEQMPTIPARNAVHPLMPIIAGGVSGGKIHIWR